MDYYIASGEKNAMFTLRKQSAYTDNYICNLSTDLEKARAKAIDFFARIQNRFSDGAHTLDLESAPELFIRRGKLSAADTLNLLAIERDVFPFGKFKNEKITGAEAQYLLYWADHKNEDNSEVVAALSAACMGVALEMGYIAQRNERRAVQNGIDSQSDFIGDIGDKLKLEGVIESVYKKSSEYGLTYDHKIRSGDNIIKYFGSKCLGIAGDNINFTAKVKAHEEYNGIKRTAVSHPKLI